MATSGGPDIVKNNLVVHLDAANIKSFRGEPTVNYIKDNLWNGDGGNQVFATKGFEFINDNKLKYNKLDTVLWTPGTSLNCYLNGTGRLYFEQFSTVWTFSCYIKREDGGFLRGTDNNLSVYIYNMNSNTGVGLVEDAGNGWYRVSRTVSGVSNYVSLVGFFNFVAGHKYYLSGWQLEKKSYATNALLTNQSRGETFESGGGWVDMSGRNNHGVLTNNPIFNKLNLGSLNFSGTNDSISIPFNSSMDFSQAQTICMWLKPVTGSNSTRRNPYNQAYGGSGTITHEPGGNFNYYFGTHGGNNVPYVGVVSGFTVLPNELAFITVTRSQTLNICRWYKNALLFSNTTAGNYSSTNNGNSPILIANGYTSRFIGDIFYVAVYNKYFDENEVLRIYNATKNRFGL